LGLNLARVGTYDAILPGSIFIDLSEFLVAFNHERVALDSVQDLGRVLGAVHIATASVPTHHHSPIALHVPTQSTVPTPNSILLLYLAGGVHQK